MKRMVILALAGTMAFAVLAAEPARPVPSSSPSQPASVNPVPKDQRAPSKIRRKPQPLKTHEAPKPAPPPAQANPVR